MQPRRKVGSGADYRFPALLGAKNLADDHVTSGNPDPTFQIDARFGLQSSDPTDDLESRGDRSFDLVLVRDGPAKVDKSAIANQSVNVAFKPVNDLFDDAQIADDDRPDRFRIQPIGEHSRIDQIAKQDREASSLGVGVGSGGFAACLQTRPNV